MSEAPKVCRGDESHSLRGTFREMLSELVEYRELLWQMTLRDMRIRYKQAVMGLGWALFMPMLVVGAGFVIKYAMTQMAGAELEVASFSRMAVKALFWAFLVGAIGFATNSLTSNTNLVNKVYFPREVFPLSAVLAQAIDTAIGGVALAAVLFLFLGVGLSLQILWALPLLALLFAFTVGMAMALSCANLFFRDVKYIVQILLTFGIFFTPVFYELPDLGATGSRIMILNPLTPLLEGLRLVIVEHHNLLEPLVTTSRAGQHILVWHPLYLLYATIWALPGCLAAWFVFHKLEFVYAEYA